MTSISVASIALPLADANHHFFSSVIFASAEMLEKIWFDGVFLNMIWKPDVAECAADLFTAVGLTNARQHSDRRPYNQPSTANPAPSVELQLSWCALSLTSRALVSLSFSSE
jgi:hypothetical protein